MSWKAEYALLILFCTVINYFAAILIEKEEKKSKKKLILTIDLILSFGVLFVYKYLGFLTENVNYALDLFNASINLPNFEILLPVGISFFTFQTLSYTIDVYRGETKVERHFGIFHSKSLGVPERIAKHKGASVYLHVSAFLESGFTVSLALKAAIYYLGIAQVVKGALFVKCLVFNGFFHSYYYLDPLFYI